MAPQTTERLEFPGYHRGGEGRCELAVYRGDGLTVAVVTETDDNPGISVTNASEAINAILIARYGPDVVHVEHYPPRGHSGHLARHSWDVVTVVDGKAEWKPLLDPLVRAMVGAV